MTSRVRSRPCPTLLVTMVHARKRKQREPTTQTRTLHPPTARSAYDSSQCAEGCETVRRRA
ncbi:MAG: hypothetical protein MI923_19985 [Phycisphaerales bacterium]|nr:hypothetical protein [Phycisphaerales bacterium]